MDEGDRLSKYDNRGAVAAWERERRTMETETAAAERLRANRIARLGAGLTGLTSGDPASSPAACKPGRTRGQLFHEAEAYQTDLLHEIRSSRCLRGSLTETWGDRLSAIRLSAPRAGERLQALLDEVDSYREAGMYRWDFGYCDRSALDLLKMELGSISRRLFILMDLRARALD